MVNDLKKRFILAAIIERLNNQERGTVATFIKQKLLDENCSILSLTTLKTMLPGTKKEAIQILKSCGLVDLDDDRLQVPDNGEPCIACGRICGKECKDRLPWIPGNTTIPPQKIVSLGVLAGHGGSVTDFM